jgi:hypothetical protein
MTGRTMRKIKFGCLLTLVACASSGVPAETKIAGTIQQFQKSADGFIASRREIMRSRQALLDEVEEATARLQARTNQEIAVWRIADDQGRLSLYEELAAASQEAGEASAALDQLKGDHAAAITAVVTKVSVDRERLTATARSLTALGSTRSVKDLFEFYVEYLGQTVSAVQKLEADVVSSKDAAIKTMSR